MKTIFTMSLYASAMIGITVLARLIFLKRSPKIVFKLLWLAAAARMLIPLFLKVPVCIRQSNTAAADPAVTNSGIIPTVYIIGVIAVSAFFAAAYIKGLKKYRDAKTVYNTELSQLISQSGAVRKVEIRVSEKVFAPITYGIFRPKIICPANLFDYEKTQIKYAVYHELVHIKRFDAAYKLAVIAAVCIHWFNPTAWLMLALSERDTELACDEEVLTQLGGRENYVLALLAFEEKRRTAVFTAFGQNAVKERIELIMKFKKTTAAFAAAAAIAICTAAVFAVLPVVRADDTDIQSETDKRSVGTVVTNENGGELYVKYLDAIGSSYDIADITVVTYRYYEESYPNAFAVYDSHGSPLLLYSCPIKSPDAVTVYDSHGDSVQPEETYDIKSYGVLSDSDGVLQHSDGR